jgi:cytochrome P450
VKATVADDPLLRLDATNRNGIYRELRERIPVYRSVVHSAWVLTRYADVNTILRHPDALALEVMPYLQALVRRGGLELPSLLGFYASLSLLTRPPRHDALRRVLAQALAGISRLNLPELLGRRADQLLDAGQHSGSMDLADGFGRALALFVIGTFLGVPEEDLPMLSSLASEFMVVFERIVPSVRVMTQLDRCAGALTHYFAPLLVARRKNPRDDGLSMIVRLADEQFGPSDQELVQNCLFFFIAAEETTSAAISAAAMMLLERPTLRARLSGDPALQKAAALEFLRLASPIQYVARQLREDIEIAGEVIHAGEPVMLMLGAANRDPTVFPDPDEPVLDRSGPRPLMFATGPYSCVGAQLATLEVEIAMRKLLERPHLRLSSTAPVWSNRMNIAPLLRLQACFSGES